MAEGISVGRQGCRRPSQHSERSGSILKASLISGQFPALPIQNFPSGFCHIRNPVLPVLPHHAFRPVIKVFYGIFPVQPVQQSYGVFHPLRILIDRQARLCPHHMVRLQVQLHIPSRQWHIGSLPFRIPPGGVHSRHPRIHGKQNPAGIDLALHIPCRLIGGIRVQKPPFVCLIIKMHRPFIKTVLIQYGTDFIGGHIDLHQLGYNLHVDTIHIRKGSRMPRNLPVSLPETDAVHALPHITGGFRPFHLFNDIQVIFQCGHPRASRPLPGTLQQHGQGTVLIFPRLSHGQRSQQQFFPAACGLGPFQRFPVNLALKKRRQVFPVFIQGKQQSRIHIQLCLLLVRKSDDIGNISR